MHYTLVTMFSEQALETEMCSPENVAAEEWCKLVGEHSHDVGIRYDATLQSVLRI